MIQIISVRTKIFILCMVSVLTVVSCASGGATPSSDAAKVYLVERGPVPGENGNFWAGLEGAVVDLRPWGGTAEDAAGVFYLAADEKNLYMRAEISDFSPQFQPADNPISAVWNATSIELFFGTKTGMHEVYEDGDSHLNIWVVPDEDGAPKVRIGQNGRIANERQYEAAVDWGEKSYVVEGRFSLDLMGIYKPLKAGQKIRCEFRINHAKPDAARSIIVNWKTPTDDAYHNPNVWSDGIVLGKP